MDENTLIDEPDFPVNEKLEVWLNAGFGNKSYSAYVDSEGMIILPIDLVQEIGIYEDDTPEWHYDENSGIIYISVSTSPWKVPDWLDIDE